MPKEPSKPLEERIRARHLREIRAFLRSPTPYQMQQLCFCAKEIELDAKVPNLTSDQKRILATMQTGILLPDSNDSQNSLG